MTAKGVMRVGVAPAKRARTLATMAGRIAETPDRQQESLLQETAGLKLYSSIPQPPRLPLFGHTHLYRALGPYRIDKYHEALQDLYKKYGPVVRQQLQGGAQGEVVHVFEAEDVIKVLAAGGKAPAVPPIQEGSRLYRLMKGHSVGLGNLNGEQWQSLRKAAQQHLLKPQLVAKFLPEVERISQILIEEIRAQRDKTGAVPSFYGLLARWYLEISGAIMFEKPLGALNGSQREQEEAQQWIQSNIDIFRLNARLKVASPLFKIFPIRPWRKLVRAEDTFHHFGSKHLLAALQRMEKVAEAGALDEKFTFLTAMMQRDNISKEDLVFFVQSMFSDGLATLPSTLQSCIHCLAEHPRVQEKLFEEVNQNVDFLEPMTPQVLDKLSYTKAVIKETFRMYPLGTEVSRVLQRDMVLGGYLVPAGTVVDLNHSSMLKSEKYFPEPYKFIPERWMRGDQATQNTILLTPFGHGPRMCIGRRFSQQSLHAGLARLVQRFRFVNPENNPPYGQVYQTLLFPSREIRVQFHYRHPY